MVLSLGAFLIRTPFIFTQSYNFHPISIKQKHIRIKSFHLWIQTLRSKFWVQVQGPRTLSIPAAAKPWSHFHDWLQMLQVNLVSQSLSDCSLFCIIEHHEDYWSDKVVILKPDQLWRMSNCQITMKLCVRDHQAAHTVEQCVHLTRVWWKVTSPAFVYLPLFTHISGLQPSGFVFL